MGMAASQARLLSITSRMSDNELRAQLINNAKMRLTTDSSRVSDEYISALNQTQLMFSNYDTAGNEQYQNLTFNSLTAYSSYNNQYGLVNNAGELLVSSTDASNFDKSNSLEAFLGCYGLAQDTTYFDKYKNDIVGYYDSYGQWQELGVTVGDMKDIYEGNIDSNGVEHYGYEGALNSLEFGDYSALVQDYRDAKSAYKSTVNEQKNNFMNGSLEINGEKFLSNGKNFETIYNEISSLDAYNPAYTASLRELISTLKDTNILKENPGIFTQGLDINLGLLGTNVGDKTYNYVYESKTLGYAKIDADGNILELIKDATNPVFTSKHYSTEEPLTPPIDAENIQAEGRTDILYETTEVDGDIYNIMLIQEGQSYVPLYEYEDEDGNIQYTIDADHPGAKRVVISDDPSFLKYEFVVTDDFMLETLKNLAAYIKDNAFANLSDEVFIQTNSDVIAKRMEYYEASKNLAEFIYGENGANISDEYYEYLDDPSWVLSQNQTDRTTVIEYERPDGTIAYIQSTDINKTHYNPNKYETTLNYQVVKDAFLTECMLDHYGEPNYTWIDKNNPDENAEAKAQWYTNLYERMKAGYKEIPQNLMASQEWLQFAFESGLMHMEQVDKSNNWTSTMYSNCSNITESTVDVDITIAEAKYKREMNKIQAKDKQYDIELKNIDTEHSSLQSEYDSIKSVIDKNVERNFKMFQA